MSFESYISKLVPHIEPPVRIQAALRKQLSTFVGVFVEDFAKAVVEILQHRGSKTVNAKDIQTAVRVLLKGEPAKLAQSAGVRANTAYSDYIKKEDDTARVMAHTKAKLTLPVARVKTILYDTVHSYGRDRSLKITETAPVYLTAVVEYLIVEILQVASKLAQSKKKKTITTEIVDEAIKSDPHLSKSFCKLDPHPFESVLVTPETE